MKSWKKAGSICVVGSIIALVLADFSGETRTREPGLELIGKAEGCRRDPYHCPSNVLTVGIGSTASSGEPIDPNKRYSDKEIAKRWVEDIKRAEECVNLHANGRLLPQGAFEAATSITFNVGCGAMQKSTLFRYARQGNIKAMCNEFPRWKYAGGKVLPGLVKRRSAEKALCLSSI
ncbi:lysozyme [Pasteurellaceae bacterium TAE3-ERU1]|uniref:lysozyme n=1 Tax=Spirabiliibacterium mucosae TaxID=28156 RepID=UPI001AACA031|nr:lysozyme [Spirabiliibacterium mucosae]MBE2898095.1 lysozyme [Spirabiliibacterium mucosae]MBV7388979.1 lysozyme [Pasteurellaceae bacterium TAE3-ERU1]